jgi:hypothetical protein
VLPPTPTTTLSHNIPIAVAKTGVSPLISGLVAEMFGTRYMATLFGISFVMHQAGFSLGAWGGGVIFTATGSYDACPRSTNESLARRCAFIVASEISVLKERA